jgi:hypothetical protein
MNPSGMRMDEKQAKQQQLQQQQDNTDERSTNSYKSTHSSRSSVLERAREYNRRIEKQNHNTSTSSRSGRAKSLERGGTPTGSLGGGSFSEAGSSAVHTPRSQSAGRISTHSSATGGGSRMSTRERAMKSVRKDVGELGGSGGNRRGGGGGDGGGVPSQTTDHTQPLTPASHMSHSSHVSRPAPTTPRTPPSTNAHNANKNTGPVTNSNNNQNNTNNRRRTSGEASSKQNQKPSPARSMKSSQQPKEEGHDAIVTPELLVDALSGHEDGLLAIAEKLMEHYDAGYDVMGEAIIDAFADVQKLFQHVVEAAHMEGAAFEASRREVEMAELRRAAAAGELTGQDGVAPASSPAGGGGTPSGPNRHDEFIDQDVKDVMNEVIRQGADLREHNKHTECYELYEHACQQASSLLPVDSDHRGRLQLSIARAESMSADRACAILRYAMDDVLRSGLKPGMVVMPDPSKRADVVLNRPQGHSSMSGVTGQAGVVQSGDEALASLMEEMKEIMGAPVFKDTPLQSVARRFWMALNDAQKSQQKNEERLEQNLGKLKGDYLLARAVRYFCLRCVHALLCCAELLFVALCGLYW